MDKKILDLSSMAGDQIREAVRCFLERDFVGAGKVIEGDEEINDLRYAIEDECTDLIATQQPVVFDLRKLVSITHIAVELERMGDYAKGIVVVTLELPQKFDIRKYPEFSAILHSMMDLSCKMLEKSMEAIFTLNKDEAVVKCKEICEEDDVVDELCGKACSFILSFKDRKLSASDRNDAGMKLPWIAHDLERIADRSTNIAERASYLASGSRRIEGLNPSIY